MATDDGDDDDDDNADDDNDDDIWVATNGLQALGCNQWDATNGCVGVYACVCAGEAKKSV